MEGDIISRQAALSALGEEPEVQDESRDYDIGRVKQWEYDVHAIKSLSSAQQWIPVTEGLPKVKQRVLVQQKDGFMMVRKCIDGGHLVWFYSDIVAWMPVPAPYREGGQNDGKN